MSPKNVLKAIRNIFPEKLVGDELMVSRKRCPSAECTDPDQIADDSAVIDRHPVRGYTEICLPWTTSGAERIGEFIRVKNLAKVSSGTLPSCVYDE
jgi:hypothetical protein